MWGDFFFAKEVLYRSRSPGVYGFTAPAGKKKKKFKENLKCQNATFPKDVVRYHWGVNKAK